MKLASIWQWRRSEQEQISAYEEAHQQRKALMATFERAYRACLEGRDYNVKSQ